MWQIADVELTKAKKFFSVSGVHIYGPYFRFETNTQSADTARKQVESCEIWGRMSNSYYVPVVQAYFRDSGLLNGRKGIAFMTSIEPEFQGGGPMVSWYLDDTPGVMSKGDFAVIPAYVLFQNQY